MAKTGEVITEAKAAVKKVPTSEERIAQLENELKEMKSEWDAYKKVSPFYKQTKQVSLRKQKL
jgi:hypothetical protein